jgi:hypothetical protein
MLNRYINDIANEISRSLSRRRAASLPFMTWSNVGELTRSAHVEPSIS